MLRIIYRKGYPSFKVLKECYRLLDESDIPYARVCFYDEGSDIVPYGYFIQKWIEGTDALEKYGEPDKNSKWVKDFVKVLKMAYQIELPYFGYLADGPKYPTLKEYYQNMDKMIDSSFGQVFKKECSIWDLEKHNITSLGFLRSTFIKAGELAGKIESPVKSGLVHGDTLPQNLLYTKDGLAVIDWDEARACWWIYDLARIAFYVDSKDVIRRFIEGYDDKMLSIEEIDIGIRLEHVRQLLRYLFISCFNNSDMDDMKKRVKDFESQINLRLSRSFL